MEKQHSQHLKLAQRIAAQFSVFPNVEAVGLAGSQIGGGVDQDSDIDLYLYTTEVIPLSERRAIVEAGGATRASLDLKFWDLGDEWYDAATGIEVDIIYWDTAWIVAQLERVLGQQQASMGYSTCFWHTLRNSVILYDRRGWLQQLKEQSAVPFPEPLRRAIIAKNHPVLRQVIPSYRHQIAKAIRRQDLVSLNHRVAALLASYFDVLFALNRLPHPGEKRLLKIAAERCEKLPLGMTAQVEGLLHALPSAERGLIERLDELLDGLDLLLLAEGFTTEEK